MESWNSRLRVRSRLSETVTPISSDQVKNTVRGFSQVTRTSICSISLIAIGQKFFEDRRSPYLCVDLFRFLSFRRPLTIRRRRSKTAFPHSDRYDFRHTTSEREAQRGQGRPRSECSPLASLRQIRFRQIPFRQIANVAKHLLFHDKVCRLPEQPVHQPRP